MIQNPSPDPSAVTNPLGQLVGPPLNWTPARLPAREAMEGRYCRLEPLEADRHAGDLFAANRRDERGAMWTYLPYGPFANEADYRSWMKGIVQKNDPLFFAIVDRVNGAAVGVASYLRIEPAVGSIEVGHLAYSPALQRTRMATEAMALMMERAFGLGYRRYEWKCDALNAPSRAAAQRLGFTFEGIFRQATVVKGRNRDTAWFSVIDPEWPRLRERFNRWLDPANFDESGNQKRPLGSSGF